MNGKKPTVEADRRNLQRESFSSILFHVTRTRLDETVSGFKFSIGEAMVKAKIADSWVVYASLSISKIMETNMLREGQDSNPRLLRDRQAMRS